MNLFQKINAVQKLVTSVVKDSKVDFGKGYMAVSHDAVTEALHMPIAVAGIVCFPSVERTLISTFEIKKEYKGQFTNQTWYRADLDIVIKFINSDEPSEMIESKISTYALDTSDKAIGKAYSLGVKNILLKVFMLESKDKEEDSSFDKEPHYEDFPTQSQSFEQIENEPPILPPAKFKNHSPTGNIVKETCHHKWMKSQYPNRTTGAKQEYCPLCRSQRDITK